MGSKSYCSICPNAPKNYCNVYRTPELKRMGGDILICSYFQNIGVVAVRTSLQPSQFLGKRCSWDDNTIYWGRNFSRIYSRLPSIGGGISAGFTVGATTLGTPGCVLAGLLPIRKATCASFRRSKEI